MDILRTPIGRLAEDGSNDSSTELPASSAVLLRSDLADLIHGSSYDDDAGVMESRRMIIFAGRNMWLFVQLLVSQAESVAPGNLEYLGPRW